MNDNSSKVLEVDINEILPNRFQPRRQFDEEEILELSDSIKEHGIIQPIVVRTIGDKYEIISGERRYKASVLAGRETVPVIIKNLNDKDSAEVALIENIQRKNLTPIEEALSYKKILDLGYITQEKLAFKLGKSQSSIANKIRLLNLSDDVQEALLENKISERHARSLLRLKSSKSQNEMLERIINERLTVRRTDEEIDKINNVQIKDNEEKGEINMNNNIGQEFDIFGTNMTQNNINPQPLVPTVEPQPTVMPEPIIPTVEPQQTVQPMMSGINFDANGVVAGVTPQPTVMPESVIPTVEPIVPVTSPIIEQTPNQVIDNNIFASTSTEPVVPTVPVNSEVIAESNIPEPIIITDYNKQYDPIMPQTVENIVPVVDFKEVINAIRECSSKIEQYGFKIDVEEFDLSNMYQVIFKIEK